MRLLSGVLVIMCASSLQAFETQPWMREFLECHFTPSFTYRHYPSVNGAYNPTSYSSNDRFTNIDIDLGVTPWEGELCIEFADTRRQSLGTQSAGGQIRYQWLNDISGSIVSYTSGLNIRWASKRSLKDVSCPYHAEWNFELGNVVGKEFALATDTFLRTYGFLGVGQANQGRPWVRGIISVDALFKRHHRCALTGEGYFGFGTTRRVNVNHFRGYANIFHQSIDLGVTYDYKINSIWGVISLFYSYRVYAKDFPAHANTFKISYSFPFSFF